MTPSLKLLTALRAYMEEKVWAHDPSAPDGWCYAVAVFLKIAAIDGCDGRTRIVTDAICSTISNPNPQEAGWDVGAGWMQGIDGIWYEHAFLIHDPTGMIVDLTADQFGWDQVIITTEKDSRYNVEIRHSEITGQYPTGRYMWYNYVDHQPHPLLFLPDFQLWEITK